MFRFSLARGKVICIVILIAIYSLCSRGWAHSDLSVIHYGANPNYDRIPITPNTWREVDLTYVTFISGKRYRSSIELLRPIKWFSAFNMKRVGSQVRLSYPQFGIVDTEATIVAIKPTTLDTRSIDWHAKKDAPVIGVFQYYTVDVRTYTVSFR